VDYGIPVTRDADVRPFVASYLPHSQHTTLVAAGRDLGRNLEHLIAWSYHESTGQPGNASIVGRSYLGEVGFAVHYTSTVLDSRSGRGGLPLIWGAYCRRRLWRQFRLPSWWIGRQVLQCLTESQTSTGSDWRLVADAFVQSIQDSSKARATTNDVAARLDAQFAQFLDLRRHRVGLSLPRPPRPRFAVVGRWRNDCAVDAWADLATAHQQIDELAARRRFFPFAAVVDIPPVSVAPLDEYVGLLRKRSRDGRGPARE
jgi:hypothetical protein